MLDSGCSRHMTENISYLIDYEEIDRGYVAFREQFWTTVNAKNINGEAQIHAKVDGKKVIISEASIMRDLRVGKDLSSKIIPLFPTMMVQAQEEIGEGSVYPTNPHHAPIVIQPSTSQPSRKHKSWKTKIKDTKLPQTSVPIEHVADEAVNEEMDDCLEKATTTATSLDADLGGGPRHQDTIRDTTSQTRSENVSKISNDPLLVGVNTPQNGKDSLKLTELMELCTNLQQRVFDLETTKTSQTQEITSLKKRVKRLEKKRRSTTHGLKRLYKVRLSARVESSTDEKSLGEEDAPKQGKISYIDANQDIYLAKFFMEFMEKRRKFFAAKRTAEKRNKPPTKAQQRKVVESTKKDKAETVQESSSKRAGDELEQERSKKQKVEDDKESEELKND
uniref:Retrovirus-related Pol polyprotein from transposon TNT 1-94-like beta-barrel domain-containing protein n=1 Tax=Tanacetum cinerariifolium TaxID=118510 RepID=A0A699HRY2_TANCI|nr:hypothetical protein [Tanacetum cinerariifolium]